MNNKIDKKQSNNELTSIFDTTTALSSIYLWLLLGHLSTMISCDTQRLMNNNIVFRHIICLVAFFFLFTVLDPASNKYSLTIIWKKTIFVYIIFLFMLKSKIYFSIPVLVLLMIDQHIKIYMSKLTDNSKIAKYTDIRTKINYANISIVVAGFIHYVYRQKKEFGADFKFNKLLFDYKCNNK